MPLDAICLAAVREELTERIKGMKIDKIQQPERDVILLTMRGGGEQPGRLLISAGSNDMRVHLTTYKFENPKSPPMFCMLLRKHIAGAKILGIKQPPSERVLELELETSTAMGEIKNKSLIIELIGRMSNVLLIDNDGIIIDCLRRIGGDLNDKRIVLPGLLYRRPPPQEGKHDPLSITDDKWRKLVENTVRDKPEETADKWLLSVFTALSPLICREISWRAYGVTDIRVSAVKDNCDALQEEFFKLTKKVKSGIYEPWLLCGKDNTPREFSYTHIMQYEDAYITKQEESFSCLLDEYYTRAAQQQHIRQRASVTNKTVCNARDRLIRKLTSQRSELEETSKREYLRECGDLITANLHIMQKGLNILTVQDFYSEDEKTREIKLDPLKSPQQNAERYYKAYTKSKNAALHLTGQIKQGENELAYLESVAEQLERVSTEQEINEIRGELMQTGYIRAQKKNLPPESAPMYFMSSTGMKIYAGKNNIQNDRLTMKTALKTDVWFHTQKIHGAHVILSCEGRQPDEKSMFEAAVIAAYYSAARSGGKVPVDYTLVRHVKKLPGGRPGMVIYTEQKTILAVPDEELINKLKA